MHSFCMVDDDEGHEIELKISHFIPNHLRQQLPCVIRWHLVAK